MTVTTSLGCMCKVKVLAHVHGDHICLEFDFPNLHARLCWIVPCTFGPVWELPMHTKAREARIVVPSLSLLQPEHRS